MFTGIKNNLQRNKYIRMLTFIVAGTQSPTGLAMIPEADMMKIVEVEPSFLLVSDPVIKDASGNVAVKATAAGIAAARTVTAAPAQSAPAAPQTYKIETGVALPERKRGGLRSETYPFSQLEAPKVENGQTVYASFFVPATEKTPNPAKSLASTVSSATRKYKKTDRRRFVVRPVDGGARIWRIENATA